MPGLDWVRLNSGLGFVRWITSPSGGGRGLRLVVSTSVRPLTPAALLDPLDVQWFSALLLGVAYAVDGLSLDGSIPTLRVCSVVDNVTGRTVNVCVGVSPLFAAVSSAWNY